MAKYFEVDFRKGSFNDTTGLSTTTVTGSPLLNKSEKGITYSTKASNYASYGRSPLPAGAFTVVAYAKPPKGKSSYSMPLCGNNGGGPFSVVLSAGANMFPMIYAGATNFRYWYHYQTTNKDWHCYIFTLPGSAQTDMNNATLYIDGVQMTPQTTNVTGAQSARIGSVVGGGDNTVDYHNIAYLATYDHVFTEQERSLAYKDFLNSYPQGKDKYSCNCVKPMDLSREKDNTVGGDLMQNFDFNTWELNNSTILSSSSFATNSGVGGGIKKNNIVTIGKKYRCILKGTSTGGTFSLANYNIGTIYGSSSAQSFDFSVDFIATTNTGLYLVQSVQNTMTFEKFIIQELTGLVAAYNFIPNGNTLVDISGNNYHGTLVGNPIQVKGGMSFNGINQYINFPTAPVLGTTFSMSVCIKPKIGTTSGQIIQLSDASASRHGININAGSNTIGGGYYNGSVYTRKSGALSVSEKLTFVTSVSAGVVTSYLNGVEVTDTASNIDLSGIVNRIGAGSAFYKGEIYDIRVHNRALTLPEIKAYHNSFVSPTLSESFDMEGADGVSKVPSGWIKQSGSFKIGEHQIITGNLTSGGWSNNVTHPFEQMTISGLDLLNVDNISARGMCAIAVSTNVGKKYRLKAMFSNFNFSVSAPRLVYANSTALTSFNDAGMFKIITPDLNIFEFTGTAGYLYIGIRNESGSTSQFSMTDFQIEEVQPLPTFKPGTKYLECVTAGTISIPSKQAYGSWEFDWYKGHTDNDIIVRHIKNNKNTVTGSYQFRIYTGEDLYIRRDGTVGGMQTGVYITNNTWYRVRIIRTLSGVTTLLLKGGGLTATNGYDGWHLVVPISGANPIAADNTYTTSELFELNLMAGDRIANIQLTDGIKQL